MHGHMNVKSEIFIDHILKELRLTFPPFATSVQFTSTKQSVSLLPSTVSSKVPVSGATVTCMSRRKQGIFVCISLPPSIARVARADNRYTATAIPTQDHVIRRDYAYHPG